ncbi:hypothetical protein, partial [Vibrio diabolicus]|uniref:hypothetical protein n=1 Tax=Vibrio diabolicus TaxID=50719 RepID=UPI002119C77E
MELTTPEKTDFQRVDLLLNQQTHRAELQPRTDARLTCTVSTQEQNNRWDTCQALGLKQQKLSFDHR